MQYLRMSYYRKNRSKNYSTKKVHAITKEKAKECMPAYTELCSSIREQHSEYLFPFVTKVKPEYRYTCFNLYNTKDNLEYRKIPNMVFRYFKKILV